MPLFKCYRYLSSLCGRKFQGVGQPGFGETEHWIFVQYFLVQLELGISRGSMPDPLWMPNRIYKWICVWSPILPPDTTKDVLQLCLELFSGHFNIFLRSYIGEGVLHCPLFVVMQLVCLLVDTHLDNTHTNGVIPKFHTQACPTNKILQLVFHILSINQSGNSIYKLIFNKKFV